MNNLLNQLKANQRVAWAALIVFTAGIILRFPGIIGFLPDGIEHDVAKAASEVVSWAWTAILFFVKSSGTSGIGTPQDPLVKPDAQGQSKPINLV